MRKLASLLLGTFTVGVFSISEPQTSHADVLCQKGSRVSKFSGSTCPRRWRLIIDTASFQGPAGANGTNGTNGADGSLRVYGDGSDGALNVSSSGTFSAPLAQYTDVTIASGVTLTVKSGTTIRCTGTFTNNGSIVVQESAQGAISNAFGEALRPAAIGLAIAPPQEGEWGLNSSNLLGGIGGQAADADALEGLLNPGLVGGSGGGSSKDTGGSGGGDGGGSFRVLCRTGIVNSSTGQIYAYGGDAPDGGGGGGGGVIILASPGSITNAGTINVSGGEGGPPTTIVGSGGGGGGGIVHLVSPVVNSTGTVTVDGGLAGSVGSTVTNTFRSGGSGGGASGGNGSAGATVSTSGTQSGGATGQSGQFFTTLTDPTGLI